MVFQDQSKLYTVAEFDQLMSGLENRDRRFELIDGEIVEKMPTQLHGFIVYLIAGFFFTFLRQNPLGRVYIEARYQLPGDEHNARIPDLSVVLDTSRPVIDKGPAPYMPDLVVEVKSPDDELKDMQEKADYYLANGTKLVWLVYPEKRLVIVRTPDTEDILNENETLDSGAVLPGFTLPAREIFQV